MQDIVTCRELFRGDMLMHVEFVRESDSLPGSMPKSGCYVLPVIRHVLDDSAQSRDELAQAIPALDAKVRHVIEYHRARQISFVDVFYQGQLHPVT